MFLSTHRRFLASASVRVPGRNLLRAKVMRSFGWQGCLWAQFVPSSLTPFFIPRKHALAGPRAEWSNRAAVSAPDLPFFGGSFSVELSA
jgi:hypothetical protein